jgi:hypothetical protein
MAGGSPRFGRAAAKVALESVELTPGAHMLLVRYRVLRPGVLDLGPDKFAVVHEKTGDRIHMTPVSEPGGLSLTEAKRRVGGYVLVANAARAIAPGSLLTVTMGGNVWEHVVVA